MSKTISYIILYAVLNVSGAALIKLQLRGRTLSSINEWFTFVINIPFITAFALIMFSALALFKALSTNNFSFIIPLATGVNFILTIVVGYYLFQDRLSPASLLGFVLIIVGIMVLSVNNPANAK